MKKIAGQQITSKEMDYSIKYWILFLLIEGMFSH